MAIALLVHTTQAQAGSVRARPPLALMLRQHCDPQPSAAAHRQLSTSPPENMGLGHVVRGTYGTAGPRRASMNTTMLFVFAICISCSGLGYDCSAWLAFTDDPRVDVLLLTDLLMLTAARPGYGRRANLVVPSRSVGAKPNLRHPAKFTPEVQIQLILQQHNT